MFETFLLIAFGLPIPYLAVQLGILVRWRGTARKIAWRRRPTGNRNSLLGT